MKPIQIVEQFQTEGIIKSATPFGNGYINDTFRVLTEGGPDYLLQRINHQVFHPVKNLMDNIRKVTTHLHRKNPQDELASLTVIPTIQNNSYYQDEEGNYWRLFVFLEELVSYDVAESSQQIYEGGRAFGRFLWQLRDFPIEQLHPIIPNFHNVISRLQSFKQALVTATPERKNTASSYSQYILNQAPVLSQIQTLGEKGEIPLRVTHNDTKFNNVLLDKTGIGRCVIDLDTVMPGYVHYDFGDGVRTSITTAPEDEPDLQNIQIDLDRYRAFAEGYLSTTASLLNSIEIQYLSLSGALMAYIMGVRFLTDYLMGDIYYKIQFPDHNLQRARCQLELTRKIIERRTDLDQIIKEIITT